MLELVDLTKRFKQQYAVKNLNMFIEKGEIIGLLGPNGAGKSTAISMMSSLVEPTAGDVRFNNNSILKKPAQLRKVTGIVPQEIALYNDLTAEENLQFFGRIYRLKGAELKRRMDEVLDLIGLKDRRKDIVKKYSGGMKRRLNIGVALLHDPELIIMDEPTVGIDPQSRNYILETVKRLNAERNITVLYTSHYMEEVEFLCDRIYIMDKGNLIASGTKDDIKRILSAEKTISIKADRLNEAFIKEIKEHPLVNNIQVEEKEITIMVAKEVNIFSTLIKMAEDASLELSSVAIKTPTLEDVFLHLTGRALRD
ncbi:ABC transporter ATP-binding protein [Virgibacillus sp. AGTR]|uniref:ABC transporter ATP-binding protein n=1 Tax=Virgibacillus salarius TaxID=447199 RepID=A0A941DT37_9BACI|nr:MULTISPECIES: ABC transporter ATP-binding protein [Bacillaceae]MBR7794654.1 ABC transporter ATP-binding protein [Virgibacillus salarius]NAZ07376.1 ATP-binding cassette domain-containing protein [Agaribacter marinus]MCC2250939.1 ABC transporter ATP-binding protein [Virgibacillus sp. AGTR]MDY7044791.1 ABC transporter ATP-binding protein [Virgibacillus sp. M23]QRZ16385.1 ABC transporter ATP-binding protein [Virgibacillus sp. AGTR]